MAKINIVNLKGEVTGETILSDAVFGIEPNKQALYDAIILQRANMRQGTHKTKGRSEVRGGGKKPWRQKGTGRARQGTIRAPQWKGGGVVFGPTPRSYALKMNKKVRKLALKSALSYKLSTGNLIILEDFLLESPKTSLMISTMNTLNASRKPLLVTSEYVENIFLSTRNIPGMINLDASGINVLDISDAHKLIITKSAIEKIEEVLG